MRGTKTEKTPLPFLFAFTLFLSATLLFLVQPMIAKMILPSLGGTPAVWNTCMVFFQAMLLAGYAYVHASTTRLSRRPQLLLHVILLFVPLLWYLSEIPSKTLQFCLYLAIYLAGQGTGRLFRPILRRHFPPP